jgi:glycogen(starch) synthase
VNIAILVAGLPPDRVGGAERQAAQLAGRLVPRHAVTVFTRTATVPATLATLPGLIVVQRSRVGIRGVRFVSDIVQTLALLGRRRKRIDVILAYQTVIDGLIGVLARRLFGIPVIVSVRCDTEYQLDRFFQSRAFSPFVFRHADRLAVQSPTLGDELVRALERSGRQPSGPELRAKLFVLPNGIAPAPRRERDGEGVLYVGRLTREKSVDVLIEAMRACPNERLTIVGDGPERAALEQAARALPQVSFVGWVAHAQVEEYLSRARVVVLPSRQEGQPNVVMEAMARGIPVIATRVGGVPDLITHGESGWLTDPGDARAIALGIQRIANDEAFRQRIAANGIAAMRRYDWPAVVDAIQPTLEQLGHSRRRRMDPSDARNLP